MIQDNGRVKRSEKGLLTPDNCAVAFIDHQPQMLFGTCVALPTVQALHDGYDINVAKDCCGDVSQLAHDNGMQRVVQAGAKPVTALSVLLEWQRDWAQRDTYDAVMDLVKRHFGAYGIGVEYAYTMVHGAPPSHFPEYAIPELAVAHSQVERQWPRIQLIQFPITSSLWRIGTDDLLPPETIVKSFDSRPPKR